MYYSADGEQIFTVEEIRERVYQKEPEAERVLVCYCFGHTVGETNEELKALIAATPEYAGTGFHVPNTNGPLLRWCYDNGLRMVKAMTLMTVGLYNEPKGAYLPSVIY